MTAKLSGLRTPIDAPSQCVHRALCVPEILHEIFVDLGPDICINDSNSSWPLNQAYTQNSCPHNTSDRKTLVSLAVTCRAFSSPALDILWEVMSSIRPLFAILPGFEGKLGPSSLHGPVDPLHWERFRRYANRIRRIYPTASQNISKMAYFRVTQLLKGEPLLPRLRSLTCRKPHSDILFLAPPNLRYVSVKIHSPCTAEEDRAFRSLLHGLTDISPSLHDFRFDFGADILPSSFLTVVARFRGLRRLSLTLSSPGIVEAIFTIQSLSELCLDIQCSPSRLTSSATGLPNLKGLIITAEPLIVGEIIDHITSDSLSRLYVAHCTPDDQCQSFDDASQAWEGCLDRISRWSQSLSILNLVDKPFYDNCTDPELELDLLDKLLQFPNLAQLYMDFFFGFETFEGDSKRMASAWPHMHTLHFYAEAQAAFSLFDLETFALHWPSLRDLCAPFNLGDLPQPRCVTNHQLQCLRVQNIYGDDPILVARHLDSLFPFLSLTGGFAESSLDQVEEVLEACRGAREAHENRRRINAR